jgi:hypothetical protein
MMIYRDPARFEAPARHLHGLGPRVLAEFLCELGTRHNIDVLTHLLRWQELKWEQVCAAGGDRFPPRLTVVPREG